ncbi:MAG: YggS family pyridoxal phosphate-dependent enzyme [Colwellia sp.]
MTNIKNNLDKIKAQIQLACQLKDKQSCPETQEKVSLLAVSKTKPASDVEQAYEEGQYDFGENYLQESLDKIKALEHLPLITWHFIGPIQSNKTKQIAQNFSWVHSVDREKIAYRLNEHLSNDLPLTCHKTNHQDTLLNVCLQVNISEEASKSGVSLEDVFSLANTVDNCDKLVLRGIMAIPAKNSSVDVYEKMQTLYLKLKAKYPTVDTLSLGMSNDLEIAIQHGSTMVRVGSAIFGERG